MISYKDYNQTELENSIKSIYSLANIEEQTDGRAWYHIAHEFTGTIAKRHNLSIVQTAAILSSLSPATHWSQNILDTENLIINGKDSTVTTYHRNKLKALKFLSGELNPVDHYIVDIKYSWTKTAAFFINILNPNEVNKVTIDRHAIRIAHGYEMTADDAIFYANTRQKYNETARSYFTVADDIGILPQQLQAITWLAYRRLFVATRYQKIAPIIL